ncbi:MAG: phosphomannomutase/phosphoglucomutase [Mizugakiibacter sp.]|uniref:phosphomannomutase/phosphoglucomutase n=1 Tax=Mizugakiibacter sp. TaxID=1972610 RepID=UPI0031BBF299|nr:phosphomannomutase/phosphoglucomutase [Xanthomonadaceae bacterium]
MNAPVKAPRPRSPRVCPAQLVQALRRLLPLAGATLLLALAAFAAWQAWLIQRDAAARAGLERVRQTAVQALTSAVSDERARVTRVLADPELLAALRLGDADGRAVAAQRAQALLPGAAVQFFSADLGEVLHVDFGRFGYAKAAQLTAALSSGAPAPMQTRGVGGERRLTWALPVVVDAQRVAYAWVELPFAPLQNRFRSLPADDGRLELRQGDGRGDMLLLTRGGDRADLAEDAGVPVPGSALRVAVAAPALFIVLPHSLALALVLAALCLLVGVTLLWMRGAAILRARVKGIVSMEEPTLADVIRETPKPAARSAAPAAAAAPAAPVAVDRSIFRAYDIRGVVGQSLSADVARLIGQAIGSEARDRGLEEIVVGRDGRLSGPDMAGALIEGLRAAGMHVIDVGAVPTPVVYFAAYALNVGSGVAVTGSHNPPDYNGFKIVLGGETLAEDAIQGLYARIAEHRLRDGQGSARSLNVTHDYIDRIASDIQTERRLKVVVDCGNGIPGAIAPQVLQGIGCEVIPLYCEVDGTFPNHHPDPSDPHNLADLIMAVQRMGADLGLAFDGDGDRLGVVTRDGEIIYPDRLLMLFAIDVLTRNPGATIIYDVKCTGHLQSVVLKHGGSPVMWRTGHSLIKAKMKETEAALAGEMSGHFFFRERWYGFDDGIYAAARLMEIVAGDLDGRSPAEIFATLPKGVSTPELKIAMQEGEHYRFMERFRAQAKFDGARITTIDGVRADWPDGWGLVRPSNTTPVLVLRFDADSADALTRIQQVFRTQLLAVDASLKLPF